MVKPKAITHVKIAICGNPNTGKKTFVSVATLQYRMFYFDWWHPFNNNNTKIVSSHVFIIFIWWLNNMMIRVIEIIILLLNRVLLSIIVKLWTKRKKIPIDIPSPTSVWKLSFCTYNHLLDHHLKMFNLKYVLFCCGCQWLIDTFGSFTKIEFCCYCDEYETKLFIPMDALTVMLWTLNISISK